VARIAIDAEWHRVRARRAFRWPVLAWLILMPIGVVTFGPLFGGPYTSWHALVVLVTRLGLPVMLLSMALLTAAPTSLRQGILFSSTDALPEGGTFEGVTALLVGMALLIWTTGLTMAGIVDIAALITGRTSVPDAFELARATAMLPYLLLVGAVAILFTTFSREAGIAIAGAYLFLLLQGPMLLIVASYRGVLQELTAYAPWAVLESLSNRNSYDGAALSAMRERALAAGRPLRLGAGAALLMSLTYTTAACVIARVRMGRRDPL